MDVARLGLITLCLMLTGCGGLSVSVTQSPTATEISVASPKPEPGDPTSNINKILNFLTEAESFTGAVLIVRNGEVLLSQGSGLADRDRNIPNTPQTKYRLGSITKQFTAMAILEPVMHLWDGKLGK